MRSLIPDQPCKRIKQGIDLAGFLRQAVSLKTVSNQDRKLEWNNYEISE
jgi:hypothetical protein